MNTPLMNDEKIIKSWDYATLKGLIFTKGHNNLTVTNKRIIATTETKRSFTKDDIPIENVREISARYFNNLSIPRIIIGTVLCTTLFLLPLGIWMICTAMGASIEISVGNTPSAPIIDSSSIKHLSQPRLKIKIDKYTAREICEQLSSIIFVDSKKISM